MAREMVRQGGRSARIQAEVHNTVNRLLGTLDRSAITVPMIAEQAGVTPSTIYRRWGDLTQLLADVAVARMRPIAEPEDTGSMKGDLTLFIQQYAEDMSSKVGRDMLADVMNSHARRPARNVAGLPISISKPCTTVLSHVAKRALTSIASWMWWWRPSCTIFCSAIVTSLRSTVLP